MVSAAARSRKGGKLGSKIAAEKRKRAPRRKELTPKQKEFVRLVLEGEAKEAAYRKAYASGGNDATIARSTRRLLKTEAVKFALKSAEARAQGAVIRVVDEATALKIPTAAELRQATITFVANKEAIAERLAMLSFTNLKDLAAWDATSLTLKSSDLLTEAQAYGIVEVTNTTRKDGSSTTRIKLADKAAALMALARLMGLLDSNEPPPPPAELEERRQQITRELRAMLKQAEKAPLPDLDVKPTNEDGEEEAPATDPSSGIRWPG